MGPLGLQISTSLYFCSNALLAFAWFSYLYRLLHRNRPEKWVLILSRVPLIMVVLMVIANLWTGALFTIGETVDSYARGSWYTLERIGTTRYLIVIFIWSVIKLFRAREKAERKKYLIITSRRDYDAAHPGNGSKQVQRKPAAVLRHEPALQPAG